LEETDIDKSDYDAVKKRLNEAFPEVVPNDDEIYKGFIYAYEMAFRRQEHERVIAQQNRRFELATAMWTFEEMEQFALNMGKSIAVSEGFKEGFIIDDYNKEAFFLLCLYFTNDPRFEQYGFEGTKYSLKKGIWLQGNNRGAGKTTLLKCFAINKRCCFMYKHVRELGTLYQKRGYDGIDMFMSTIRCGANALNFYQKEMGVMYDEVFGDSKVNYMGTPELISEYIINRLYDFSDNKKGEMYKFHVTSNAGGKDIEKNSGLTYRSRMPEMFNIIVLGGPDRRR